MEDEGKLDWLELLSRVFLQSLAVVFCVARVTTVVFQKLKQPVIFGYLLKATGLWTSCWMFFFVLITVCLMWMHVVVRRMLQQKAPHLMHQMETVQANRGGGWPSESPSELGIAALVPVAAEEAQRR